MTRARTILGNIYFSFPVQLFIVQIKKNLILLLYWALLWGMITGNLGKKFGIPFLFLDPEYLGRVDFYSMLIMGVAFGGFIMAFTITSYILNGFRFPFLAALSRPFQKYFLNNFIVPLIFIVLYLYNFIDFQINSEFQTIRLVLAEVLGFSIGLTATFLLCLTYFFSTDKRILKSSSVTHSAANVDYSDPDDDYPSRLGLNKTKKQSQVKDWRVDSYLINPVKARLTRGTEHYDPDILLRASRKNHINAALIELIVFLIIILLGLFRDFQYLRIPAGASVLLFFSMLMMLMSAYRFWFRGWSVSAAIGFFLLLNFFSQNEFFANHNQAYGIIYDSEKPVFNLDAIKKIGTKKDYEDDISATINILEKWKKKNVDTSKISNPSNSKPVMVFICTSGGGMRAALWTVRALQAADSMTGGDLLPYTTLISGASGGTLGSAYFREIYYRSKLEKEKKVKTNMNVHCPYDISSPKLPENISKDLLNPITLSIAVNDIFMNFQKFTLNNQSYKKDRAYEFEKQLNENTCFVLDKTLGDYYKPEADAVIPMMIITPTIINDGRRLYISPQPLSYLITRNPNDNMRFSPNVEGVEYSRFFKAQNALDIKFTSVLRMNSTFPYITPTVSLPSKPPMDIMDAGLRDNFGVQTTLRFLYVFKKWIAANTSRVVVLQIRDTHKEQLLDEHKPLSLIKSMTSPVETFYSNFANIQDYNQDELVQYASSWYEGKIDVVTLQMPESSEKISLSWHLTTREKLLIKKAVHNPENNQELIRLKNLMENKD